MRFLADECADQRAVAALRADGHDVLAVADVERSLTDPEVVALARDEQRILLTEDRDFGRLVYASHARTAGVIYIRWHPLVRHRLASALLSLTRQLGPDVQRAFVVLTPSGARVRRSPE